MKKWFALVALLVSSLLYAQVSQKAHDVRGIMVTKNVTYTIDPHIFLDYNKRLSEGLEDKGAWVTGKMYSRKQLWKNSPRYKRDVYVFSYGEMQAGYLYPRLLIIKGLKGNLITSGSPEELDLGPVKEIKLETLPIEFSYSSVPGGALPYNVSWHM